MILSPNYFIILICILSCLFGQKLNAQVDTVLESFEGGTVEYFDLAERNMYLYPSEDRPNKLADSIRQAWIVKDGNFMLWLERASHLYETKRIDDNLPQIKTVRPAWVLIATLILFLIISVVRLLFSLDFQMFFKAMYDDKALKQVYKEGDIVTSWPYILLYIIFSLVVGLLISVLGGGEMSFQSFLRISLIIAVLFVLKILLVRFVSFIFEMDKVTTEYTTILYLIYFNATLILLPFLLSATLLQVNVYPYLGIICVVIVSALLFYRFFKTVSQFFGSEGFSIFYLILYLCSFEIAPILILVKAIRC